MVITKIHAGLGNQMFQYATGSAVAKAKGDVHKIDTTWFQNQPNNVTKQRYGLDNFNITASIASKEEIKSVKLPYGPASKIIRFVNKKILRNFNKDYHPEIFDKSGDIYLDGYWQSEKNFKNIRNTLLKEFTPKAVSETAEDWNNDIANSKKPASLHIRRGDYVNDKSTNKYHGFRGAEYIQKARQALESETKNPTYFVFSDDIEWVKQNIDLPENTQFVSGSGTEDYEEIWLMSKCDHNIIANSSFSWWGAWLNTNKGKVVIAPQKWTEDGQSHPNIIPDNWTRV